MMKSFFIMNFLNLNYPLILNILVLISLSIPIKFNKYHPMKMILILIFLTLIISLKMNLFKKSWMNFFILLIMVGGLMVIFMYITSLNNNSLMKFNLKNILKNLIKLTILMLFLIFLFKFYISYFNNQDSWNLNLNFIEEKNNFSMMKLFNINKMPLIFIMLYLYFSLICIMNICYKMKNPLRQINF
uniref:NADH dehydrogenase subunit 6 n=1 Tax=Diadegma semiclausum TaxID=208481 RepID=C4N028_DIASM|nr:NADH dehydrogenase subunit 6 [Diadegma semiclausum]ACF35066.1 NADH dehydrogenase subunit 6 [Diadegma semiclausum]